MPKPEKAQIKARRSAIPPAVFPSPGHDHHRCSTDAMAFAEGHCASRGERLTPIRRAVLFALLDSHKPIGAYEIIERMASKDARPAPITIYRALDFLIENGLVHRIESRNAYLACIHNHAENDFVVFMICERCGSVGEASGSGVAGALKAASREAGFAPKTPVVEIGGICSHCRDA